MASWRVGEFTINVHISSKYEPTSNFEVWKEDYDVFSDGYYRLPVALGEDKWWCLNPTSLESTLSYWRPSSYESEEVIINEAIDDVCLMLENGLFKKAGFIE